MKRFYLGIYALFTSAVLAVSCVDDEIIDNNTTMIPNEVICFNAKTAWPAEDYVDSRSASATLNRVDNRMLVSKETCDTIPMGIYVQNGIHSGNEVQSRGSKLDAEDLDEFKVWATLNTVSGNSIEYFSNLEFENIDGVFYNKSDEKYYWPGSGPKFDFVATNMPDGTFTPTMADNKLTSFTYTVPSEAENQKDIVVARATEIDGGHNQSVGLNFNHIMTAVNIKIGRIVKGTIKSITLTNVYNKGTYIIAENRWSVDKTSTDNYLVSFANGGEELDIQGTESSGTNINADNATFMFIPQEPGEGAKIVVEFYDYATNTTFEGETAIKGNIEGDNWLMNQTTNYVLSIDENYKMTIEPVGKKMDAHYIIGQANVSVKGVSSWKIKAESYLNGQKEADNTVTILPESEVNPIAKQGFWTDKVVDANGNVTQESARGTSSYDRGTGEVTNQLFYIFIPENISNKDREIKLTITNAEGTASYSKVLLQKSPKWTSGGFGWEVVDDGEKGDFGFMFTRKRTFIFPYNLGSWPNDYTKNEAKSIADGIINSFDATSYASTDYYACGTLKLSTRMYVQVDYTKLNEIKGASSLENGYENTVKLYDLGGLVGTGALEIALEHTMKTESGHENEELFRNPNSSEYNSYDIPASVDVRLDENGKGIYDEDMRGAITYVLKKNRYYLQKKSDSGNISITYYPYFKRDDLKWYLPAVGQFNYFTANPEINNDVPGNYWSSTTVDGSTQAKLGNGTSENRNEEHFVIAVRADENGYGAAQ